MNLGQKTLLLLLSISIVGVYLYYQDYFIEEEPAFTKEYDDSLSYSYYRNYGNNRYLVDNWTLRYYHTNWTEPEIWLWHNYGPFSVVFETPEDDMTLKLSGVQVIPDDSEFMFPLMIYPGNAYSYEATSYWTQKVTCFNFSDIEIESKGKYTISLTGAVHESGHRYNLRGNDDEFETVLIYVSFQLIDQDGGVSKFIIDNRLWGQ